MCTTAASPPRASGQVVRTRRRHSEPLSRRGWVLGRDGRRGSAMCYCTVGTVESLPTCNASPASRSNNVPVRHTTARSRALLSTTTAPMARRGALSCVWASCAEWWTGSSRLEHSAGTGGDRSDLESAGSSPRPSTAATTDATLVRHARASPMELVTLTASLGVMRWSAPYAFVMSSTTGASAARVRNHGRAVGAWYGVFQRATEGVGSKVTV